MYLRQVYLEFSTLMGFLKSISLLLGRVLIAYGFYEPALLKWSNFDQTIVWFSSLGIPFSSLMVLLVSIVEIMAVVMLFLGLFTRLVSIPLMAIMLVAIITVHLGNGFSVANNGFEIPLYYLFFLSIFVSHGAGKFSLDYLIFKKDQ
jgi:putative oxidoreductase